MRATRVLFLLVLLCGCVSAQETGLDLCSLLDSGNGAVSATENFSPPAIVELLVSEAGLEAEDFHLVPYGKPPVKGNAFAQYCGKPRWNCIFYDPAFVPSGPSSSDDVWFARFVFAHEVGHHLKNHFLGPSKLRPDKEAEADEWAGWAMEKIGAPIEKVMAAIDRLQPSDIATDKYYGRCHRRMDALRGYNSAARGDGKPVYASCMECYPASTAGLYLTRAARAGSPFSADLVQACGSGTAGADRPFSYKDHLAGGCLSADTPKGSLLTWDGIQLCK
jgi:hypothetical protein